MGAGKLRDRATVQRQAETDDGYGNVRGEWSDLLTVWADVRERSGKEKLDAGAVASMRMATVRVRQSSETEAVTEADRLIVRGQIWNILSIAQVERAPVMLEFNCQTGVAT